MLSEKDHINIELYLSKQLQGEDKTTFESELYSRSDLMEEARLQRKISQGLQLIAERNERQELREFLNKVKVDMSDETQEKDGKIINWGESLAATKETKVIPMWQSNAFRMAIAASFVGILAVSSYYLFLKVEPAGGMATNEIKNDSAKIEEPIIEQKTVEEPKRDKFLALNENQKLADSFYTDLPKFRADVPLDLIKGIELYYANKPQEALKVLPKDLPIMKATYTQTQKDSTQNRIDNLTFYRGLSYFKTKKSDKAVKDLEIASKSGDITIQEFANWYLGLAYLRNNQIQEAKNTMQKIQADDDSRFSSKAIEILGKIK